MAELDRIAYQRVQAERELKRRRHALLAGLDEQMANFYVRVTEVMAAALIAAGYHQHDRGTWRKKRLKNMETSKAKRSIRPAGMSEEESFALFERIRQGDRTALALYFAGKKLPEGFFEEQGDKLVAAAQEVWSHFEEQKDALQRAQKGDRTALALMNEYLDSIPAQAEAWGNMATHVEQVLLQSIYGENLLLIEAVRRKMQTMREDLAGPHPTPLEKLLVDRIVLCWVVLQHCESLYAYNLNQTDEVWDEFCQKRLDRAQKRYLSAIKALAQVRRLLIPWLQVNIADKQLILQAGGQLPGQQQSPLAASPTILTHE